MTRVGIIGAGAWGRNHVRTFASLEEAELVALADSRPDVLAAHRRTLPGLAGYADGRELLDRADVEAVVIATPAPTHHALARAALESGRHVLVEKPLALSTADAEDLARLADERGLVLMVGHLLLYHAAVEYLKQLVDSGELGDLLYGYCQRLNLGVVRPDENALWSLAPHDFSVLAWLLGEELADVSARGADYLQPGIEDVVFADLRWRNGRIRPDAEITDLVLQISGGLDSLGPGDFDSFIFYGARLRVHDFFKAVLDHESRPEGYISEAQMRTMRDGWLESIRAWRLARKFARKGANVVFVPTALPSAGVVDKALEQERLAVRSTRASRARLWGYLQKAAGANGFALLAQPEDSVTDNTLTRNEYATPDAAETRDWVHKSPEYAARMIGEALAVLTGEVSHKQAVQAAE